MEVIVEYNSYDDDIKNGDIVVFLDGTRKVIKKVDDHRLTFEDGSRIDLWVVEIKGIIKNRTVSNSGPMKLSTPKIVVDPIEEIKDILGIKEKTIPSTSNSNGGLSYQELFTMMERADNTELNFSKYFWHYTPAHNLIKIISCGYFRSRYNMQGNIPFDNKKWLDETESVLGHNLSKLTERHARFYLNPKNAFAMYIANNVDKRVLKYYCAVAIRKEALYASRNSTFLYYQNANKATDDVFKKEYELNNHQGKRFRVHNLQYFNFAETYSNYDPAQSKERKLYQMAEFLVWKDLSIAFIDKIIFYTKEGMDAFLLKIKDSKEYNVIRGKCSVDWRYFFYKFKND